MGHGLTKPASPWAVATVAIASPALYTDLLLFLERFAEAALGYNAATFGAMLKTFGAPIFVAGHATICLKKPALESPDVCYMSACSVLSMAFAGAYCKKPLPEAVLASSFLFYGAYLPLRWRLIKAKASPLIPTLGVGAAILLTLVGATQVAIKYGVIQKAPEGPTTMPQAATLAGTLLGVANTIKLLQMIQQEAPQDNVFAGQVLKVVASVVCFAGNTLGLGWQKKALPKNALWRLQTIVAIVHALRSSRIVKPKYSTGALRGNAILADIHNAEGFTFRTVDSLRDTWLSP